MNEIIPFGETWIPEAARRKISEWRARMGLTPEEHRLIDLLASHSLMRNDVWPKLPACARGAEGVIIEWAFVAARMAAAHKPFAAKASTDGGERSAPHFAAEAAALHASMLLELMRGASIEARLWWPSLWAGDPWMTFEKILGLVEQLQEFYTSLDRTGRQLAKALALPATRRGSERAPERFFARLLTSLFLGQFGEPFTPIVAALTTVVFDKQQKAGSSSVSARQRGPAASAAARKKSK